MYSSFSTITCFEEDGGEDAWEVARCEVAHEADAQVPSRPYILVSAF